MKQFHLILTAVLSGIFAVIINALLKNALSDIPKGFLLYEAIIGAFIGTIVALIMGHFVLSTVGEIK